jgi:maltooligosyltrehalose trehalohydrolase
MGKKILFYAEDDRNEAKLVAPIPEGIGLDGLWTDDYHHQVRVMLAKDNESYFREFTGSPKDLVQTAKQGWYYAGQKLVTSDKKRGTDPKSIDDMAQFVYCIQNHDQVGNRALGGRINAEISSAAYKTASSLLLLLPQTPMLFMGQEWAASTPFCFFTDHNAELGKLVTEGRRKEFANFSAFSDPKIRESIPDPQAHSTFANSRLKWDEAFEKPCSQVLSLYKKLLELRNTDSCMKNHHRKGFEIFVIQNHTICVVRKNKDNNRAVIAILNMESAGGVNLEKVPELAPYLKGKLELLFTTEDEPFRTDASVKSPEVDIEGPVRQIFFHAPCAIVLRTQYDANTKFEAPF